jgi:hypothetical protein
MTVLGACDLLADVNVVRELERLFDDNRVTPEKVVDRSGKRGTCGGEDIRRLPRKQPGSRRLRYVALKYAAADAGGQRQGGDETEAYERATDEG